MVYLLSPPESPSC